MSRKLIYVAHALSAPTREAILANLREGAEWCAWIAEHFDVAPIAPWIYLASVWDETPENRARGLEIDLDVVARCDEIWLVGPRLSSGMRLEAEHAYKLGKPVRDNVGQVRTVDDPCEELRALFEHNRWHP